MMPHGYSDNLRYSSPIPETQPGFWESQQSTQWLPATQSMGPPAIPSLFGSLVSPSLQLPLPETDTQDSQSLQESQLDLEHTSTAFIRPTDTRNDTVYDTKTKISWTREKCNDGRTIEELLVEFITAYGVYSRWKGGDPGGHSKLFRDFNDILAGKGVVPKRPEVIKRKITSLLSDYTKALLEKNHTGNGVEAPHVAANKDFRDHLHTICPYFDQFHAILSERMAFNPLAAHSTGSGYDVSSEEILQRSRKRKSTRPSRGNVSMDDGEGTDEDDEEDVDRPARRGPPVTPSPTPSTSGRRSSSTASTSASVRRIKKAENPVSEILTWLKDDRAARASFEEERLRKEDFWRWQDKYEKYADKDWDHERIIEVLGPRPTDP